MFAGWRGVAQSPIPRRRHYRRAGKRGTSDQQIESVVALTPEDLVPQEHPDPADIAARQTGCFRSCSSPSAASRQERLAIRVPRTTVELHGDLSPLMPGDIEAARR